MVQRGDLESVDILGSLHILAEAQDLSMNSLTYFNCSDTCDNDVVLFWTQLYGLCILDLHIQVVNH